MRPKTRKMGLNKIPSDSLKLRMRHNIALSVIFLFLLVYASIALVNHYCFRTHALDMGYFLKGIYDFSLFRFDAFSISQMEMNCIFADHFNPSLILIAPLRFLFGTYTLAIVQISFILIGTWGAFVFIRERSPHFWLPVLGMIHFGLMWSNFESLAYDFHDSIPGAMLLPWLLHFFLKKNWKAAVPVLLFMIGWKETIAIWLVFISAGLWLSQPNDKQIKRAAIVMGVFGLVWSAITTQYIIPSFDYSGRNYRHFNFSILGNTPIDVIKTLLTRPGYALRLTYMSHDANPTWIPFKMEMITVLLASGGLLLFLRPAYLLMIIPVFLQKVWNDDPTKWGVIWHYGIEFVPVVSIGIYLLFMDIRNPKFAYSLALIALASNFLATSYVFSYRKSIYKSQEYRRFYRTVHYSQPFSIAAAHKALKLIPSNAVVSASHTALPHLALREKIYMFPDLQNAEYIFLIDYFNAYPVSYEMLSVKLYNLKNDPDWEKIFEEGNVYVFRKRPAVKRP